VRQILDPLCFPSILFSHTIEMTLMSVFFPSFVITRAPHQADDSKEEMANGGAGVEHWHGGGGSSGDEHSHGCEHGCCRRVYHGGCQKCCPPPGGRPEVGN